jgi:hypothetical protein
MRLAPGATLRSARGVTRATRPPGDAMAQVPLSQAQRRTLIRLITERAGVLTQVERENLLENAGLTEFAPELHLDAPADDFAQELVRELQAHGTLAATGQPALVSLLRELRAIVAGHEADAAFVDTLLAPYGAAAPPHDAPPPSRDAETPAEGGAASSRLIDVPPPARGTPRSAWRSRLARVHPAAWVGLGAGLLAALIVGAALVAGADDGAACLRREKEPNQRTADTYDDTMVTFCAGDHVRGRLWDNDVERVYGDTDVCPIDVSREGLEPCRMDDIDLYRIAVARSGFAKVELSGTPVSPTLKLFVYDAANQPLTAYSDQTDPNGGRITSVFAVTKHPYYVAVVPEPRREEMRRPAGTAVSKEHYDLTWSMLP